jgi:hypothetical protein
MCVDVVVVSDISVLYDDLSAYEIDEICFERTSVNNSDGG